MTGLITAIVTTAGVAASLLLHLFKTRWSAKAKWLKKLKELEDAFREADEAHELALAGSDANALSVAAGNWLLASEALAAHRADGQRQGVSG